jgi:LysM repeat protein
VPETYFCVVRHRTGLSSLAYSSFSSAFTSEVVIMGVLDKLFGQNSEKDKQGKPDFSDVRSGSSSTAPTSQSQGGSFNRTYTVVAGDSLSKIAKREYGDASKWHRIFEANRDKIQNPDLIHPGQVLNLPQG